MTKLKCPHCGSDKFRRTTVDLVNIVDDGIQVLDVLVGEFPSYTYKCDECKREITDLSKLKH